MGYTGIYVRVVVVIPALDEERSLPLVLADIPHALVEEVVVVDNGSRDRTADVARAGGATLVREPRQGYGQACLTGIATLSSNPPDIVVFVDADYSDRPSELPQLIDPILAGQADMVIGSRILGEREPGALAPHARWGKLAGYVDDPFALWSAVYRSRAVSRHTLLDSARFRNGRSELRMDRRNAGQGFPVRGCARRKSRSATTVASGAPRSPAP